MKFEEFKRIYLERIDEYGYIQDGYKLFVDGELVHYSHIDSDENNEFIYCSYYGHKESDLIYKNEDYKYKIQWFVLEKEDE